MIEEVTTNNFWLLAVALIFLPLTGKNGVAISVSLDCKTQFQLTDSFNAAFYHKILAII